MDAKMVWVDVETTGLDEQRELLTELAIVITDPFGEILDEYQSLIFEPTWHEALVQGLNTDPKVLEMHRKSGLTQAMVDFENALLEAGHAERLPVLEAVCWDAIAFLGFHGIGKDALKLPMAGSSIHFDRRWITWKMPELNDCFHYRNIDTSTINGICQMVNPQIHARIPEKNRNHRALADCRESIEEYRWFLDNFLWVG